LVAIAIIVALCSGAGSRGTSKIRNDIRDLDRKIGQLEQMVQELRKDITSRDKKSPLKSSASAARS